MTQSTISQASQHISGQRYARSTSPTVPEYHQTILAQETEKEAQTDLYVVPVEKFLLEKEKLNQYSKENSRLVI